MCYTICLLLTFYGRSGSHRSRASINGMAIKSHLLDGLGFKKEKMFSVFFERIQY